MSLTSLRVLLLFVGIAFAVLTAWSLRYFSHYQPLAALSQNYLQPGLGQIGLEATDVRVVGRSGGQRRWRMTAQTVVFSRDRRLVSVYGIRQCLLYDAQAHPRVTLTAGSATYQAPFGTLGFSTEGALQLGGGVQAVILSPGHPTLQTQGILWDSQNGALNCPGPLIATIPRLTVAAGSASYRLPSGPTAAPQRGTLHLGNEIRAEVQSARGRATLACPGLAWDGAQNIARTLGPVTAQIPGGLGTATADDMAVDTKSGNLTGHGFRGTLRLSPEVQ